MKALLGFILLVTTVFAGNVSVANCSSRSSTEANVDWTKFDCEGGIVGRYSLQELYEKGWRAKVSYRDGYTFIIFEKEN